ncbi:MAG TPA: HAD family hydrolase [Prevotella sp.]
MSTRCVHAFDFDGTLTTKDTLIEFIRYACGTRVLLLGLLRHSLLLVAMKLHLYANYKAKQRVFAHFFAGMPLVRFNELCRAFARQGGGLLRPAAVQTVQKALQSGAEVLIVSASIDNWVRAFLPYFGADGTDTARISVLGTQVETNEQGLLTGHFASNNCYGAEKVRRITAHCGDRSSYKLTAYGDSRGDKEMLMYADQAFFRPFRR